MSADTVLIECLDRHHRVTARERFTLDGDKRTLTIGRSVLADVVLSDEHAAELHASIEITLDGAVVANDLGSLNGLVVAGKRHRKADDLVLPDNALQVGRTHIRVRTSHDDLAPEKPDRLHLAGPHGGPALAAALGAVALTGEVAYASWLDAPSDLLADAITMLSGTALVFAAWVAIWAVLSRIVLGEWHWLRHMAVAFGIAAIFVAVSDVLEFGWFAFALPEVETGWLWLGGTASVAGLYLHLRNASRLSVRHAAFLAFTIPALALGTGHWISSRSTAQNVNHISASLRVYPPAYRMHAAEPLDAFFDEIAGLREEARDRRDALPASENSNRLGLFGL